MPTSERFLVSARKFRPRLFSELVAQEHVAKTLQNALKLNRLAHAYLLSGPRGVGKTTAARILAKAVNCEAADTEPCRKCTSCRDFEQGRSMSIFEIDAASNNSVDDVRELQETVQVPPQGARRKVYIVDEVHMLSKPAFNALLKTLEEPPPHMLFVFATTEPHKLPLTILSRCQRFDFRRIPVSAIVSQLEKICVAEGVTADESSLLLLAHKGDGAMRDALSAFDQAVALCGTDLQYAELAAALGVVDTDLYFEATQYMRDRSLAGMLRLVETVMHNGHDIQEFLAGLADHVRNLLIAKTMPDPDLIQASQAMRARYVRACQHFGEPTLVRLLMAIETAQRDLVTTTHSRLRLELALMQMATMQDALVLSDALAQVDRMLAMQKRGMLRGATGAPPQRPSKSPPVRKPRAVQPRRPTPAQEAPKHTPAAGSNRRKMAGPKPSVQSRATASRVLGKPALQNEDSHVEPALDIKRIRATWNDVARKASSNTKLGTAIAAAEPHRLDKNTLHITVTDDWHKTALELDDSKVLTLIQQVAGRAPAWLAVQVRGSSGPTQRRTARPFDAHRRLEERVRKEPVVKSLVEKLGVEPI